MFPMFSMLPPYYIQLRKMFAAVWWCGRKASNRGCSNWSCIYWDNIPNPLASEWGGESVKWALESRQTMMESLFRWIGLERCLVMFASEIATPTTQIEQVSKDNCFLLLQTGTWDVISNNSIRIVLDDWSISISYENRRLVVNADQSSAGRVIQPQLLFTQFLSIDHVLQKLQYVDKSIYVGASPLQYMD